METAVNDGLKEGKIEVIENLLQHTPLTIEEIAKLSNISIADVLDVQQKLKHSQ